MKRKTATKFPCFFLFYLRFTYRSFHCFQGRQLFGTPMKVQCEQVQPLFLEKFPFKTDMHVFFGFSNWLTLKASSPASSIKHCTVPLRSIYNKVAAVFFAFYKEQIMRNKGSVHFVFKYTKHFVLSTFGHVVFIKISLYNSHFKLWSIFLSSIKVRHRYKCNWRTTKVTNKLKVTITIS